jgi:hypothetical protein
MNPIDRPIFLVGMPRSGSTAYHRVLAEHPSLATTTHLTRKAPACYPALKLLSLFVRNHKPGEAGTMWDKFVTGDTDILRAADVTPASRRYYTAAVANVLRLYDRPRFVSKCPRNGMRMDFLRAIFPDALFIHLVRDGRAVCRSVLERRQRAGDLRRWWDVKPDGWRDWEKAEPVASVAHQWRAVVRYVREVGQAFPAHQFLELRYEDFTRDPVAFLGRTAAFCGLDWGEEARRTASRSIEDRNDKWEKAFSPDEVATLNAVMDDELRHYGYR